MLWSLIVGIWHKFTAGFHRSPPPSSGGNSPPPSTTPPTPTKPNNEATTPIAPESTVKETVSTEDKPSNQTSTKIQAEMPAIEIDLPVENQPITIEISVPPPMEAEMPSIPVVPVKEQPTLIAESMGHLDPNAPIIDSNAIKDSSDNEAVDNDEQEAEPTSESSLTANARRQKRKLTRRGIRLKSNLKSDEINGNTSDTNEETKKDK